MVVFVLIPRHFVVFFVKVMCAQYLINTRTRTNAMHIHITHNNYPAFARFSLPLHSLSHLCAMKSALWINYEKLCKGTRRSKANMFFLPGIYVYIHIFVCTSSARARGFRVHPLRRYEADCSETRRLWFVFAYFLVETHREFCYSTLIWNKTQAELLVLFCPIDALGVRI